MAALAAAGAAAAAVIARLVVFVQRPQSKPRAKADHTNDNDIAKHRVSFLSASARSREAARRAVFQTAPGTTNLMDTNFTYFVTVFRLSERLSG